MKSTQNIDIAFTSIADQIANLNKQIQDLRSKASSLNAMKNEAMRIETRLVEEGCEIQSFSVTEWSFGIVIYKTDKSKWIPKGVPHAGYRKDGSAVNAKEVEKRNESFQQKIEAMFPGYRCDANKFGFSNDRAVEVKDRKHMIMFDLIKTTN